LKAKVSKTFPPALRACWIKLNSVFAKRLQNIGLTPDQYTVLRWLHEINGKEICQKNLTSLMFTDANNIAALVKRMEKNGLVRRNASINDKRKKNITSTKLGTKKWLAAKEIAANLENTALSALPKDERKSLTALLRTISEYLN
jgi:DNA-binding MarR family transcriptional regulator